MATYEITVGNVFDAESPEDAVMQMATWLTDHATQAGYRVTTWIAGAERTVFIDADDLDFNAIHP